MNAQEAMNRIAIGRLRRALQEGTISPDELQRRLSRAIDREMQKGARRMDARFVRACEELLWQLNAPATEAIPSGRRDAWMKLYEARARRGDLRPLRCRLRPAALALSLVLAVGGGLWMISRRPPRERIHTSQSGPQTPAPADRRQSPAPRLSPLPTATPTPSPSPTAAPTLAPVTPVPTRQPRPTPLPTPELEGRAKYRDIQALIKEAPARWRGSYSDVLGRQVEVDVPVKIPDVRELPALRLRWIDLSSRVLGADTAVHDALSRRFGAELTVGEGFLGSLHIDVKSGDKASPYFYGPRNRYAAVAVYPDAPAQGNDLPRERPFELMREILRELKLPADQFRLDAQAGTSGFYYGRKLRGGETMPDIPFPFIDQSQPAEEFAAGFYRLSAMQVLRGLPVFPLEYLGGYSGPPYDVETYARMKMLDEKNFSLDLRALEEAGVREADLPLMNMEAVIRSAERLITAGLLRRVDSLELGYMLYYAEHLGSSEQSVADELIALPVWRLRGIKLSSVEQELTQGILSDADAFPTDDGRNDVFELRFSAQTGEYIDPGLGHQSLANPLILTWQQMDSSEQDIHLF